MSQKFSVTAHPIDTLLTWVISGEIVIPEIQRPFVWNSTKVRNLLDSLYQGYPVGYLISWKNPTVKLKDGTAAAGKRILIDGQQRVTALIAAQSDSKLINVARVTNPAQIADTIKFASHANKPQPMHTLTERRADILEVETETAGLLDEILEGAAQ